MSLYLWPEGAPFAAGITGEDQPSITPYLIESEQPSGAVIICPGGGYTRRANHEGEPVAKWLNSLGISAFVLHYRVHPYKHPVPLMDAQRAIRVVRNYAKEWNIDASRVGILGFSAGGHLASTAGTCFDSGNLAAEDPIDRICSRPDLMILCYPVITFGEYRHQGSQDNLLGEQASEELRNQLSTERRVTPDTPPTFLWHTMDDASVPVENSFLFASALRKHQVPVELHCYESGRHGLGLAEEHPEAYTWPQLCELWLKKQWSTNG
ncbi:alpha/beta hydrolase [Ammoniphilus sp. YIM 78166]|uniref:alpha/beta hydrolase n=1 Tax=Ammoniphilus sp. YIM 78166 TaxID=1644106 RepID=UPI00106F30DF|nr:alpha/beta hydrolase [Ammoniphilus sp. YIM 78166]